MEKKTWILIFCLLFIILEVFPQKREDVLFEKIPIVITASKKEQPINESPSTITILTSEDIAMSAATTIPDILRMVAGVDVMNVTARDQQVAIRGLNNMKSNKLLVLVDGRSVYINLYGSVYWDILPVTLDEVERIEIVKSPVSSLYGANAFSGVINIISKKPKNVQGNKVKIISGNYRMWAASFLHGGGKKNIKYKISGEWNTLDEWQGKKERAGQFYKCNTQVDLKLNTHNSLSLSAGRGYAKERTFTAGFELGPTPFTGHIDYLKLNFNNPHLRFQLFYTGLKGDIDLPLLDTIEAFFSSTTDAELIYSGNLHSNHFIVLGLNFRRNWVSSENFSKEKKYTHDLWAVFFEDDIKLSSKVRLILGGRFDSHPLVGKHLSPRVSFLYQPVEGQFLRLSIAKAYRNPAFVNSYFSLIYTEMITLPSPYPAIQVPFSYTRTGNEQLKSEKVFSYEAAYHMVLFHKLNIDLNFFINEYRDMFLNSSKMEYYEKNELFPGSPGSLIPKVRNRSFVNMGDSRGIGGEISMVMKVNRWFKWFANYSFQKITDLSDNPFTNIINEENRIDSRDPKHKINAGVTINPFPNLTLNVRAHWVDKVSHILSDTLSNEKLFFVDDYLLVNMWLGYRFFKKKALISLSIFNIFNHSHFEYPSGLPYFSTGSHEVSRRFILQLGWEF